MELDPGIMELIKAYMQAANMGMASPSNNAATYNAAPDMATNQGVSSQPSDPSFLATLKGIATNPQFINNMGLLISSLGKHGKQNAASYRQNMALRNQSQQQELQNKQQQQQQSFQNAMEIAKFGEIQRHNKAIENERVTAQIENAERIKAENYNKAEDNLRSALQLIDPSIPEATDIAEMFADDYAGQLNLDDKQRRTLIRRSQAFVRGMKSKQPKVSVDEQSMQDWLEKNPGKGPSDYVKWKQTNVPAYNFNLQQSGMGTPLSGPPEQMMTQLPPAHQSAVKALLEYRKAPPTGYAMARSPFWSAVYSEALQIDPTYDEKQYPTRSKIMADFTSGKGSSSGAQINAINTVLGHTAVLGEAVSALKNGNILALNAIANQYGIQAGKDPVTTLKAIVNRVGPEVTRAYVGTGGEASERKENEGDFNPNYSPDQLLSNVKITIRLLRSKMGALENQWNKGMGRNDFEERFIIPEAKAAIAKWGGEEKAEPQIGDIKTFPNGMKGKWDGKGWRLVNE